MGLYMSVGSESEGQRFDSSRAHHFTTRLCPILDPSGRGWAEGVPAEQLTMDDDEHWMGPALEEASRAAAPPTAEDDESEQLSAAHRVCSRHPHLRSGGGGAAVPARRADAGPGEGRRDQALIGTAKVLGLTIPQSLLLRADHVSE